MSSEITLTPDQVRPRSYVEWHIDIRSGATVFCGCVHPIDLLELRLDQIDHIVLNEPIVTAADFFQNMELIFRRMAQQAGRTASDHS